METVSEVCRVDAASGRHRGYIWFALALPLLALLGLLYSNVLTDLALDWWTNPAASQGLLIPPFAIYIAWLRRRHLTAVPRRVDLAGLLVVGGGCLMLVAGRLAAEYFLMRISFVVVLAGLTWTFAGRGWVRQLAFPFALLATMVPLPSLVYMTLAAPLQLFVSDIASALAEAAGVSLYRDGNVIYLATITLGVEEACSGLTSLSSLLVGGVLFGFLLCARAMTRLIVFLAAVPVAIFANMVRVTGTAVLSDSNPAAAMGFYHAFSGWAVFVLGAAALYGLTLVFRRVMEK